MVLLPTWLGSIMELLHPSSHVLQFLYSALRFAVLGSCACKRACVGRDFEFGLARNFGSGMTFWLTWCWYGLKNFKREKKITKVLSLINCFVVTSVQVPSRAELFRVTVWQPR